MKIVTSTEITLDFKDLEVILREKCHIDEDLTLKNIIRIPASHTLRIEFEKITDSKAKIPTHTKLDKEEFLKATLKSLIKDFGLSTRSFNCLNAAEVKTTQDILKYSTQDLLKFRNLGSKGVKEVKEILKKYDLFLPE